MRITFTGGATRNRKAQGLEQTCLSSNVTFATAPLVILRILTTSVGLDLFLCRLEMRTHLPQRRLCKRREPGRSRNVRSQQAPLLGSKRHALVVDSNITALVFSGRLEFTLSMLSEKKAHQALHCSQSTPPGFI